MTQEARLLMNCEANRRQFLSTAVGVAVLPFSSLGRAQEERPRYIPGGRPSGDAGQSKEVARSYVVFDDKVNDFIPGGYMPDGKGVSVSPLCTDRPEEGEKCVRIGYRLEDNLYVAVAFLLDNQWEPKRTFNLYEALGARPGDPIVLRFHVRSADRATAKFKVGGLAKDSCTFAVETPWKSYTGDWTPMEIDLADADLSSLHGALIVVLDREHNAGLKKAVIQIDVDEIYFTVRGSKSSR
jgi:hypothetical protein